MNNNLTYHEVRESIKQLAPHIRNSTPTNVIEVKRENGVLILFDNFNANEIKELKLEIDGFQEEINKLEVRNQELLSLNTNLETCLEVYSNGEMTPQMAKRQVEQAQNDSCNWKRALEDKQKAFELLRKKKGMWVNFIKSGPDITGFIQNCANGNFDQEKAEELLAIIKQK